MHKDPNPAAAPSPVVPAAGAAALDLDAFWMPFTASRQFKTAPRLLAYSFATLVAGLSGRVDVAPESAAQPGLAE